MSELSRFVIGRRIAEKARAPLLTAARKALQKGKAKLVKQYGGDTLMVFEYDANGNEASGLELLQRGQPVTLKMWRTLRESVDFFDPGERKVVGELVVRL